MANEPKFPKRIREAFTNFPNVRSNREIMSGAPCVANRRIPVWILSGRFVAGESAASIAKDYDLRRCDVMDAVKFTCWLSTIGEIQWWRFHKRGKAEVSEG